MRDRRARVLMVGFILGLPWLMVAMSPSEPRPGVSKWSADSAMTLASVEMILVGGLVVAAGERRRLRALRENVAGTHMEVPAHPRLAGASARLAAVGRRAQSVRLSSR